MIRREARPGVWYADDDLLLVAREDIEFLNGRVGATPLKRIRLCAHRRVDDRLHEMFIVHSRDTYIRPHRHLGKAESMLVLHGAADAVFFDDDGRIVRVVQLGDFGSGSQFFYRIDDALYHSLVIRTETLAFKEATTGPLDPAESEFAPWSPAADDVAGAQRYATDLRRAVDLFLFESAGPVQSGGRSR